MKTGAEKKSEKGEFLSWIYMEIWGTIYVSLGCKDIITPKNINLQNSQLPESS